MRMGNGMGCVYKMKGKRRKPWRAVVTARIEYDEESGKAKQIRKVVGNYTTQKEALESLTYYNKNPYDMDSYNITFSELYERWNKIHFETITQSAQRGYKSAYNHSKLLHNMKFREIRPSHMEQCLNDDKLGVTVKPNMKTLYSLLYKYALKNEIVEKNYASMLSTIKAAQTQKPRIPYTDDEIKILWDNITFPFVDMVLIGIYSGWRPQELSILRIADIDLENRTYTGGLKTEAGKNRTVPIHSKVFPLVQKRYNQAVEMGSQYLFNDEKSQKQTNMNYEKYKTRFKRINKQFGISHRPHDTRHTFATLAKHSEVDEYLLKMMIGHSIDDITERIYTHRTIDDFRKEIEKIK